MRLRTLLFILLAVAATAYLITRFFAESWGLRPAVRETIEGGALGVLSGLLLWLLLDFLGKLRKKQ